MPETTTTPAKQKISKTASKASSVQKEADSIPAIKTTRATRNVCPPIAMITTSEERHRLIAEAAYYLAEKRGFQGGNPDQDWVEAATKIDSMFMN
jgi:hypothetical protein